MIPAVFLDRDGVINEDTNLISRIADFHIYPYAGAAIQKLTTKGFTVAIITNQSAIARGLLSERGLADIHDYLQSELRKEGAEIDGIYYCPHHPEGNFQNAQEKYIQICDCRKPNTGMLEQAKADFGIDFKQSWLVGDSERDIEAGKRAGVTTIAVQTGHGNKKHFAHPDFFCHNLEEAAEIICDDLPEIIFRDQMIEHHREKGPLIIHLVGDALVGKTTLSKQLQRQGKINGFDVKWIPVYKKEDIVNLQTALKNEQKIKVRPFQNNENWTVPFKEVALNSFDFIIIEHHENSFLPSISNTHNEVTWWLTAKPQIVQLREQNWKEWNNGKDWGQSTTKILLENLRNDKEAVLHIDSEKKTLRKI